VFHEFTGKPDGAGALEGLIRDAVGNFYGTTYNGGTANAGVVYKVDPSGQEKVLSILECVV